MVLMGMELPIIAIRKQIASSVDIIIHLGRLRDRSRKVLSIDEVLGMKDGEIELNRLYEFVESPVESGNHKVNGKLEKINELVHMEKIMTYGMFGMYREVCSEAV
jgi:pilus assembly protein CpaF